VTEGAARGGRRPESALCRFVDEARSPPTRSERRTFSHLGVGRAHVVGHSTGANIALQLALDRPEVVQTLALLEP